MPFDVTLVRHGETDANRDHVWQGHGDGSLTDRGLAQAKRLAERLRFRSFDDVIASDLERAAETAAAVGSVQTDPSWREMYLGAWEGLTRREVAEQFPDDIESLRSGQEVRIGGTGESFPEFAARVDGALENLTASMEPGRHTLVVTHGGVVQAIVAAVLGLRDRPRPWPLARVVNASLTTIRFHESGLRELRVFNDASHLGGDHLGHAVDGPPVILTRHGETEANREGRWQGQTHGVLTEEGVRQAKQLADHLDGSASAVYSSPLRRALVTAAAIAERSGVTVEERPGLMEMAFGDWEGMKPDEIASSHRKDWSVIYEQGRDLPRGRSGETMADVGSRVAKEIDRVAFAHPEGGGVVVSHGGAIRSYAAGFLGLPFVDRQALSIPSNTSITTVVCADHGPVLASHNLTPHLEVT